MTWWFFRRAITFRFLPERADYDPASPWIGSGRFDDGRRLTLYLADAPEAAVAEFLRRHPELLYLQDALKIRVFEIEVVSDQRLLDVRVDADARAVGIEPDRLVSSDLDESIRYAECRELAARVEAECIGIGYPSAALRSDHHWNMVLFGPPGDWTAERVREVTPPRVVPGEVRPIGSPATA